MLFKIDTVENRMTLRRLFRRSRYKYMAANRLVPHIPWIVLFALSIYMYKARIFADSGFYVLHFINNKFFWVEGQRYVLAIPQLLPLIAVWIGVKLKYVLLLYSVSHVLFFYFLFLLTYYGLRDRRGGVLILLFQIVGIVHGFYAPMFGLYYGASLLIFFFSLWRMKLHSSRMLLLLVVLAFFILTSHPIAFLLLPFVLLFGYNKENIKPGAYYFWIALVYVGCMALQLFIYSGYEQNKLEWQLNFVENKMYMQIFNQTYLLYFFKFMLQYYAEVLIALVVVVVSFIRKKEFWKIFVVLLTILAYFFWVNSFYTITTYSLYVEQLLFSLVPIVFIPLIYSYQIGNRQGFHNFNILVLSALIIYRIVVLFNVSEPFKLRINQIEQLAESARQKNGSKFIVNESIAGRDYSMFNCSYPIETILLSSMKASDLTVSIVPEKDFNFNDNKRSIKATQFVFRKGEFESDKSLNSNYFHLDMGPYKMLNDTLVNSYSKNSANATNIKIFAKKLYHALDTVWIPIAITNKSDNPIYTGGDNHVAVSYFWVKNEQILNWNEVRTPLQADLYSMNKQYIKVAVPNTRGKIILKVDLIINDKWLGVENASNVLIY